MRAVRQYDLATGMNIQENSVIKQAVPEEIS